MRNVLIAGWCVVFAAAGLVWAAEGKKEGKKKDPCEGKPCAQNCPTKGKFSKKEGWEKLFDGKTLKGWKARKAGHMSWKAEKGLLINDVKPGGHGVDLVTEKTFDDFELHIEFKVNKGGNSGVYLRGRYEIQVLDSCGKTPTMETCGSIYSQKIASKEASKPVGEWNCYDAKLEGKTVTVYLNGELIIDKHVLTAPTGGALDDKVNEPGPLMLQGDHTAVTYRNIQIRPLKK